VQPVTGGNHRTLNQSTNRNADEEACARELLEFQKQDEQLFSIKLEDEPLVDISDNCDVSFETCGSPDIDDERVVLQVLRQISRF